MVFSRLPAESVHSSLCWTSRNESPANVLSLLTRKLSMPREYVEDTIAYRESVDVVPPFISTETKIGGGESVMESLKTSETVPALSLNRTLTVLVQVPYSTYHVDCS